jgi:uncharacterized phiE125 gp8 family phage protein
VSDLVLVAAPIAEPLTVSQIKEHARIDISDDDVLLPGYIAAARRYCEMVAGRTFFSTTWRLVLNAWPRSQEIELPRPPLQSVTAMTYTDEDGDTATFDSSNYYVVTATTPGLLVLKKNRAWPPVTLRRGGLIIEFVAGWTATNSIPAEYKQAIALLVAHWYENREAALTGQVSNEIAFAVDSLLLVDREY